MQILTFSDVHYDLDAARRLVELATDVDVVIGAGDFAIKHQHLDETIAVLSAIEAPTVVVPGNGETASALTAACAGWTSVHVCHGTTAEAAGAIFFGIGGGIPPIGQDWSNDFEETEAHALLQACPDGAILISHSPPLGHVDGINGRHSGSRAVLAAIERVHPPLVVCGHIHDCWGTESHIGSTRVVNPGPGGRVVEL
jgi:Icc-related predicted phosphoesterase